MVPPAGKKRSFLVRKCYICYWKVWLATYLVRQSINALLAQGWWRRIDSTKSRIQNVSLKRTEHRQAVLSLLTAHAHFCNRFSWSFLDCSWGCTATLMFNKGTRPRPDRGGLETPIVAWPQSCPEETLQLFKYQSVINSPWEEVGSPQFHLQAAYVYSASLSSLWFN